MHNLLNAALGGPDTIIPAKCNYVCMKPFLSSALAPLVSSESEFHDLQARILLKLLLLDHIFYISFEGPAALPFLLWALQLCPSVAASNESLADGHKLLPVLDKTHLPSELHHSLSGAEGCQDCRDELPLCFAFFFHFSFVRMCQDFTIGDAYGNAGMCKQCLKTVRIREVGTKASSTPAVIHIRVHAKLANNGR